MPNSKVPNNYFNKLNKIVLKNIEELEDDIKTDAPLLSAIDKSNFYSVPKDYFSLNEKRVIRLTKVKSRPIRLLQRFSVAASFLILFAATLWTFNFSNDLESADEIAELSYIDYLLENEETIESDIIIGLAEELDLNSELEFEDLSDSDLEIYLDAIIDDIPLEELTIFNI